MYLLNSSVTKVYFIKRLFITNNLFSFASMQLKLMGKYELQNQGEFLFKLNHCLRYGYVHYYSRNIPEGKAKSDIDKKLVLLYDVTQNRNLREKRKSKGLRNILYFRYKDRFILLATEGIHTEFDRLNSKDFRVTPFVFFNYSIKVNNKKSDIRITQKHFQILKRKASIIATHKQEKVEEFLRGMSPYSFKGINQQRWKLYLLINQKRKSAGLARVKWDDVKGSKRF